MTKSWELFRYRTINDLLWQELELCELYCGAPANLNDPFDCNIDWRSAFDRAFKGDRLSGERRAILDSIHSAFDEKDPKMGAGVCCFSISATNQLMWSHYADSHRGVCLLYEFPATYFATAYPSTEDGMFLVGGSQVFYGDDVFHDWLVHGALNQPLSGEPIENAVAKLLTVKAQCWGHEEEFRIITSEPGFLRFEASFLKQVMFGLATSERDRRLVSRIARRGNERVHLLQAVREQRSDFGMQFEYLIG